MVFQSTVTLEPESWRKIEGGTGVLSARFVPVGYDDTEDVDYVLLVYLREDESKRKFEFTIGKVRNGDIVEADYYGDFLGGKLSETDREKVKGLLYEMARDVVSEADVGSFEMVTAKIDLSDSELRKFEVLAEVFESCGYTATRHPKEGGRHRWFMLNT